jgi:hypothetical protein
MKTRKQRGGLFGYGDAKSEREKVEGEGRGILGYGATKEYKERVKAHEQVQCCVKHDCDSLYRVDKFNEIDVKLTQFMDNVKTDLLPYLKSLRQLVRDDLAKYSKPKPTGGRRTQVRRRR